MYKTTACWHLTQFCYYPVNKGLGSGTKGTGQLRWEGNLLFIIDYLYCLNSLFCANIF